MIRIAFYRGPGAWMDKLIRILTRSPYSHCELVFSNGDWFSSMAGQGVRWTKRDPVPWDYVSIPLTESFEEQLREDCNKIDGKAYDWLGVLRFAIPILDESPDKWFCSELCCSMLQPFGFFAGVKPWKLSPGDLYELATK